MDKIKPTAEELNKLFDDCSDSLARSIVAWKMFSNVFQEYNKNMLRLMQAMEENGQYQPKFKLLKGVENEKKD